MLRDAAITALAAAAVVFVAARAPAEPQDLGGDIDIPVAIGQNVKGIRFPHYDANNDGKLSMRFNAESAERTGETTFNFKSLRIEVFEDSPDKPAMEVVLNEAVFERGTGMLTSKDNAKIKGEQFEITGSRLEFDSKTRFSRLLGPVFMTITDTGSEANP